MFPMLRPSPTYEERLFDKREDWSSPLHAMTPRLAPSLARQSDHLVFMDDELNSGNGCRGRQSVALAAPFFFEPEVM